MRAGFVAVLGVPNAGKSTLVNGLAGAKVAGVSPKPQTTRRRILGVRTEPGRQFVFVDTPGYGSAERRLGERMARASLAAARDADVILYVVDAARPESGEEMRRLTARATVPLVLALNKVDRVGKPSLLPLLERFAGLARFEALVPVSALTGDGFGVLLEEVGRRLPEGDALFPSQGDEGPVRPELVQEVLQEHLFLRLHQEIPYGCGVLVESVDATGEPVRIAAAIITEREKHKPILIGKGASKLKAVGRAARLELERLTGRRVHVALTVKVVPEWRDREGPLAEMGYEEPD